MLIGLRRTWRRGQLSDRFGIFRDVSGGRYRGPGGSNGKLVIDGIRYGDRAGYLAANGLARFLAAGTSSRLPKADLHGDDGRRRRRQD